MFATFTILETNNRLLWYYERIYLYSFISLFIYVVLNLFLSVILDAYETIKVRINCVSSIFRLCLKCHGSLASFHLSRSIIYMAFPNQIFNNSFTNPKAIHLTRVYSVMTKKDTIMDCGAFVRKFSTGFVSNLTDYALVDLEK